MENIFIAVGGTGARVAEALVRLLAIGFPTRKDEAGLLTSAGDRLRIWRVDPDRGSGAAVSLQACVDAYGDLQGQLGSGGGQSKSQWSMDIDSRIRHLDPLLLGRAEGHGNDRPYEVRKLEDVLNAEEPGRRSASPFLELLYEPKDLKVRVDRGFYQKPFIGAGVMAIFADSLADGRSPGGSQCELNVLSDQNVRFFLCGSLQGGTGACGVPILGKFLRSYRESKKNVTGWSLAGCLMTPYCVPPPPPFKKLDDPSQATEAMIGQYLKQYGNDPIFSRLLPEEREELVRQILQGFYADPQESRERARQALVYYKDHSSAYFDELYLVGKLQPDALPSWSNGGKSQINPLNSAEVVGALSALNFFSGTRYRERDSYIILSSNETIDPNGMRLYDLPIYEVDGTSIDPERVFLATLILRHLVLHQIPWRLPVGRWVGIDGLRGSYLSSEDRKQQDQRAYKEVSSQLAKFVTSLIDSAQTQGWYSEVGGRVGALLSDEPKAVEEMTRILSKSFFGSGARQAVELGQSSIKVSTFEFGKWFPEKQDATRGEYLRFIWTRLFNKSGR